MSKLRLFTKLKTTIPKKSQNHVKMSRVRSHFYKKAADYWASVPATMKGVLGGYEHISNTDIEGSQAFLQYILHLPEPPSTKQVLDCGAGIGRVSKYLLMPAFDKVDLVDLDEKFIAKAREELDGNDKLGTIYNKGLQNFYPEKSYDLIWCQWVLGHLKDYDLVYFLKRCSESLSKNGVIVVKENITQSGEMEYDEEDSSVARPYELMRKIFQEADLEVIKECVQTNFPDDIYPVYMFALIPS